MEIEINKVYRHFKGKLYIVIDIAKHSETLEEYVVYRALYGNNDVWIRPKSMFFDQVDQEKYPNVKQKYRFERVE